MSKFYDDMKKEEGRKERKHQAWDRFAGFVFDLAKLSFAGVAVGAGISYANDTTNDLLLWVLALGISLTCVLACIAFVIIKYNK